jgi:hypothetical protein
MIKHRIFVNENIIVDYYTREEPSKILTFTANGAWPRMIEEGLVVMDGMGYYGKALYDKGYDVVAIKNKAYDCYSTLTFDEMQIITDKLSLLIADKYIRRIYFGGCASGWLSIALSKYMEFNTALLLMPRNELRPEDFEGMGINLKVDIDKNLVSPKTHYILCCNFNHEWDYENVCRFSNAIEDKTLLNIPDESNAHDVMLTLKRNKIWKRFFYNILMYDKIMDHEAIVKV